MAEVVETTVEAVQRTAQETKEMVILYQQAECKGATRLGLARVGKGCHYFPIRPLAAVSMQVRPKLSGWV